MRCLGLLFLSLALPGCVATHTSPVFSEASHQLTQTLRFCDPDTSWEVAAAPGASHSGSTYTLPRTQLVVVSCNVRDTERFFDRAEREFEHFLLEHGASEVWFRRTTTGAQEHLLSWKYEYGGREGLLTLWATSEDGRINEMYVTIHESRKAQ